MIDIEVALRACLYIALIILVITFIVLGIRLIKTLKKVDGILDDVEEKMDKVNGVFDIIDKTTDIAVGISDKIVNKISRVLENMFKRRKGNDLDE